MTDRFALAYTMVVYNCFAMNILIDSKAFESILNCYVHFGQISTTASVPSRLLPGHMASAVYLGIR